MHIQAALSGASGFKLKERERENMKLREKMMGGEELR